ncbi:MAG: 4'-phosphopantetheinyl transferase superfamily protein [Bacteroidota bacterium]
MPLKHLTSYLQNSRLALWHITESRQELEDKLHLIDRSDLTREEHFKSEKRNFEWLATRNMLAVIVDEKAGIEYDDCGKPHLINFPGHLSISHSWPYVCIFYHPEKAAGVDIELMNDRILKIRKKFVNDSEELWLKDVEEIKGLFLIWAAKEAVFKMLGGGGILFKEHLELKQVDLSIKGKATICFMKEKTHQDFTIYYEFLDDMILVYTIANDQEVV